MTIGQIALVDVDENISNSDQRFQATKKNFGAMFSEFENVLVMQPMKNSIMLHNKHRLEMCHCGFQIDLMHI